MDERERAPDGPGGRNRTGILLMATAAMLALLAAPLAWNEVYAFEDLAFFHLPLRIFYANCLERGWSCSSRSATPSSTPTKRGLSTGTSSRPTCS